MPKGLHTASAVILFREAPTYEALAVALAPFPEHHLVPAEADTGWMGENGLLSAQLAGQARLIATSFATQWPDGMGHPQHEPMLFGAWSMGFFGPFTWPGSLGRAVEHSYGWPDAEAVVAEHRAFVRLLATQAVGRHDPVLPEDYDPLEELRALTDAAQAILGLPGALAFFDPNGETLLPPEDVAEAITRNVVPLDVWTNIRLYGAGEGWQMMDTIGMAQLDRDDVELVFAEPIDPNEVANFLRSVSDYLLQHGPVIQDGHTVEGPGEQRWQAWSAAALTDPHRRVLRFLPADGDVPDTLRAGLGPPEN